MTNKLINTKEAAMYLGCSVSSLKTSRSTGKLLSVDAPVYRKIGYAVRYKLGTLDSWLQQFNEQNNTAY